MRKKSTVIWVVCCALLLFSYANPSDLQSGEVFITIGSGDVSGVYFPAGLAIARILNKERRNHGIRATVEATAASVFNLNAIIAGYLEFGLAQADKQYQAVHGLAEWKDKGPQQDLMAVFSVHHESVTLVAAVDAGINSLGDLKGKRVNLGNPGSGQHQNAIDILQAVGIDPKRSIYPQEVEASDATTLLMDNLIDAFFCTVGHPSQTVQTASSGKRKIQIIPISGPAIDKLVSDNQFYTKTTISVRKFYPGVVGPADVDTFGVIGTLNTSSKVAADVVYRVTKEVFENFHTFRSSHPALRDLTKRGMLKGLHAPFHSGALQYFRESGLIK